MDLTNTKNFHQILLFFFLLGVSQDDTTIQYKCLTQSRISLRPITETDSKLLEKHTWPQPL